MLKVLHKVEKLRATIQLLKAVPVGKVVKRVSKKAPEKACKALADAIVTKWKTQFQG